MTPTPDPRRPTAAPAGAATTAGATAGAATTAGAAPSFSPALVALFAVSCGVAAANLYYAQPLLPHIARDFGTSSGLTGQVVTAAQVGYGIGLALLVPLGDLLMRRRLVPLVLVIAAAALVGAAAAPDLPVLIVAVAVAGVCSVAAQILVPFAATLASPERRGRVLGTVMSGLLLGILLARTFSGLIAEVAGWRDVYLVATGVVLVLAGLLFRWLPGERERATLSYGDLLRSAVHLMATEPLLRLRSTFGALAFATFNVIWTSLAFLLAGPPYHYGEAVIGLFGLLGVAGAMAATFSGRLADRGRERLVTGLSLTLVVGAVALLADGRTQLWALMVGILLADLGIQAVHIQNQQLIFAIDPDARSRINTGYMVSYFIGGALGSATTGLAFGDGGWTAVVVLGLCYATAALVLWAISVRPGAAGRRSSPPA